MSNIHSLLQQFAQAEAQLLSTQFLAPCIQGGRICTRVLGMTYTFTPQPQKSEGWSIFQPIDAHTATWVEDADLPQIAAYMKHLPVVRLRLAYRLRGQTWLAYPTSEADFQQRFGTVRPVRVHLVVGTPFEQVIACGSGNAYWFVDVDRRSDPAIATTLATALEQKVAVDELRFKGLTPEMRSLYQLVAQHAGLAPIQSDEQRLRNALKLGGGNLVQFQEHADYWTVDWTTADGRQHTSAITKTDLTVVSSGICLSGRDRDFDLQSLVGVIEQQEW
jgi:hypothetical protein